MQINFLYFMKRLATLELVLGFIIFSLGVFESGFTISSITTMVGFGFICGGMVTFGVGLFGSLLLFDPKTE
ncbi:hypothetical protein [Sporosarcina sp. OR05]|uniref:hypothetical protein n=1 Tax=Sporosarcina sp. OR05 TaxID=2969819 RepID=UPI00352B6E78